MGRIKIYEKEMWNNMQRVQEGETSGCIKRLPSRVVVFKLQMWCRKFFSECSRSYVADFSSPGLELVFGIHTCSFGAQADSFPYWGVSQAFLVVSLTVTDAWTPRAPGQNGRPLRGNLTHGFPWSKTGVSQNHCLTFQIMPLVVSNAHF